MKKKYILCGAIALFVIAAITICIWYFSPKTFLKNTNAQVLLFSPELQMYF